ncbi:unnamed protein product [Durusdinium trenchii]|uniref:RING-type domain-containing protein n=2 Tax=Durusdinium trenchii TaxID=1381693 RepID=A0ABP0K9A1_9DINO
MIIYRNCYAAVLLEIAMRAARSLKTLIPVADREDGPAFLEGQLVKIRQTSEEEAKRVFDASGIHWNSAKAQLLGSVGELRSAAENYYAVYTPDRSDWWRWPLSMLEEADSKDISAFDRVNFQIGDLVKIRKLDQNEAKRLCSVHDTLPWEPNWTDEVEGVTWKSSMAQLLGLVGKVETRQKDCCLVSFGDSSVWWPLTMLEAAVCPQGHLLHLAMADFHICSKCGCGLTDSAAHCGECHLHFCSHCMQEQVDFRQSLEVGARVRFLKNAAEVDWNDCPGDSLPFLRGDQCRISEIEGSWFRSGYLWAPLAAVEQHDVDNAEIIFDGKDDADPYQDEWASTSTELKEKPSMFALVAREKLLLCESCYQLCNKPSSCALCNSTTNLRPSYRERWELSTPGLDEICPKEAWPGQDCEVHAEQGEAFLRKQMAALVGELTRQRMEIQQLRWEKEEMRRELALRG